jgi:glycosyltransferase involved in cell wall biosynthesis
MRIAVIHSFYSTRQPSGENRVVIDQVEALSRAGHEVQLFARRTDDLEDSRIYRIQAAWSVATGVGHDPTTDLIHFSPDIVHVHNLFPNFGTSWVARWSGPIVATVHNYRAVCASGLLFREGHFCTECPKAGRRRAVVHACYHESRAATLPVALGLNRRGANLLEQVDCVIVTSHGSQRILSQNLPRSLEMVLLPNFGAGEIQDPIHGSRRQGWVAMGRLSSEKGFLELVRHWPTSHQLVLIGDGPQAEDIRVAASGKRIEIRGSMPIGKLREVLPHFCGLIFPSLWPDVAPQVVVEAMRVGLPVIAHRANVVADLVSASGAGVTYHDAESLLTALERVSMELELLSERSIEMFRNNWTEQVWVDRIEKTYQSVRDSR